MFLLNDDVVLLYHEWKTRIFTIEQNLDYSTVLSTLLTFKSKEATPLSLEHNTIIDMHEKYN